MRPLDSDEMRVLVAGVYWDSDLVSLASHSYFVEVDERFGSEVVGVATAVDSAVVAA